jgi:hypothetical protein
VSEQSTAAAERSALHDATQDGVCHVCRAPWRGGSSYAARCLPPLVQVCCRECAQDPSFADPKAQEQPHD